MTFYVSDTYNLVAGHIFQRHYALPIRAHAERFTFFEMLGEVADKSVLDLACGQGWYPRQMKEKGAARVVGIDLSDHLIALAKFEEQRQPLSIEYTVGDISTIGRIDNFDIVTAQLMFNYAASREAFQGICDTIAANLKPGGRFVCIGFNPFASPAAPSMKKYGVHLVLREPLNDGDSITGQIYLDDGNEPTLEISHYYWSPATYEVCLQRAGMSEVSWHPAQVSPEGLKSLGAAYWTDFIKYPFLMGLSATRA